MTPGSISHSIQRPTHQTSTSPDYVLLALYQHHFSASQSVIIRDIAIAPDTAGNTPSDKLDHPS